MNEQNELNALEKEKDAIAQAVETSRIMGDLMKHHERENKRLWCAVLALALAFAIMAGCMVWTVQNAQRVANEAMLNALNTVAEMEVTQEETTTTTTTQTVEGDNAEINNVEGNQYKDSATHYELPASSEESAE